MDRRQDMSVSKNKLKYIRSLRQKKYRQMYNKFVAEGDKLTRELLAAEQPIEWVVATPQWLETSALSVPTEKLLIASQDELSQLSNLKTPQGVLVVAECLPEPEPPFFFSASWSLYLDDIQDPGNMGTMLRIADWFGIAPVVVSNHSADMYSPKVVQASMGAIWRVPVLRKQLDEYVTDNNVPIYAADMTGKSVFASKDLDPGMLIIGNEGRGISDQWHPLVHQYLSIPRGKGGGGESLNAGVACGILLATLSVA